MSVAVPRGSRSVIAFAVAVLTIAIDGARADDPFAFTARTTSGTPQTIRVSGSSLPDLAEDLVRTQSQFLALQGQAFDASLRYGGLSNAVRYSQNAAGTSATLAIPSTGFSRTFTAANEEDLRDQIEDFLREDGADEYARFLREINERTVIGVTDGNPQATTALLSDLTYEQFGLHREPVPMMGDPGEGSNRVSGGLRMGLEGGVFDAGGSDGFYGTAILNGGVRFSEFVGLSFPVLLNYRDVEGAGVYQVGGAVALPVLLLPPSSGTSWQVTPAILGGASGSVDLAAGGTFVGGSLTSSISMHFFSHALRFTMANQISFFEGFPIDVGEFDFETDLSQQVLKNGLKVTYSVNRAFLVDAGLTYTNFLSDAAVENYLTPSAGVLLRMGENSGIRLGYRGDFGDDYTAHGGGVTLFVHQ
jgi:hypothetical protein